MKTYFKSLFDDLFTQSQRIDYTIVKQWRGSKFKWIVRCQHNIFDNI